MRHAAFINPYLGIFKARNLLAIVNPPAQLPGNTNTWLSIRDTILLDEILNIAPSSRNMQPVKNWWQGRLPVGFNSRKSAHIYASPLK